MKRDYLIGRSIDYTQTENWMFLEQSPKQKVDLIFFYPTVAMTVANKGTVLAENTDKVKKRARHSFDMTASAFSSYTNVFAPYYRQIPMEIALKTPTTDIYDRLLSETEVRTDVYAALDEYFTKYNNNRPFILAGHSQGSAIVKMIMGEYMKAHPEYLNRMVAAYLVGYPISPNWLHQNPHLKFATGETDTGVLISWNTEGPHPTKKNFVQSDGSLAINPLNWKCDETPASVLENKGSLTSNTPLTIGPAIADATLNLKRGTIVCTTAANYIPERFHDFFGDQSLHIHDYDYYYANIKENGQKRIATYFQNHQ